MSTRVDILIVTRNLPPLVGGMERLIWHICDELRITWSLHVIGPTGCRCRLPHGVEATEVSVSPLPRFFSAAFLATLIQTIRRRPSLVIAGSGLTAPFAWLAARLTGARCAVYLHGLDIESEHPAYRLIWHPILRRFDLVLVNSRFTGTIARNAGLPGERIKILNPGVSLPDLSESTTKRTAFRSRYNLDDAPVMLYVGRITRRKGLDILIDAILPRIVERYPTAILVVLGDEPHLALNQETSIRQRIDETLKSKHLESNTLFLGSRELDHHEISEAYYAADVHVFPVQDRPGDNEGFGMVAVEAAAHGLWTVAYSVGGVAEAVANGRSGRLITAGQETEFAETIMKEFDSSRHGFASCRRFAEQFSWTQFGNNLRTTLDNLMGTMSNPRG